MKVVTVPTSKSYDGSLSYLQRAWHSAWHIPNGWYITTLLLLLLHLWPFMGPKKHQKSDLEASFNSMLWGAISIICLISWIGSFFSQASRVILRTFHIHRDYSWETLGKIYLPLSYPTESQRNCSPLTLLTQGQAWETFLELSLQLRAHKPFALSSLQFWMRRHPGKEKGARSMFNTRLDPKNMGEKIICIWLTRAWRLEAPPFHWGRSSKSSLDIVRVS